MYLTRTSSHPAAQGEAGPAFDVGVWVMDLGDVVACQFPLKDPLRFINGRIGPAGPEAGAAARCTECR
ncbi:MAG: hypothetical protein QOG19_2751 [Mycobacterium sp.]|nr:hypothetical protein [Mycobacterium sp.]